MFLPSKQINKIESLLYNFDYRMVALFYNDEALSWAIKACVL